MPRQPIHTWVFDLDNTLYPVATLYEEIGARMTAYIARTLHMGEAEAHELRERYFHGYGATVCGLQRHHGVDPLDFLADAHSVDYSVLERDLELADLITRLPGRKIIFTNGGGGHAERTLNALGLNGLFERVFDIEHADFAPKPQLEAYERLIAACGIAPQGAALVEDTLKNLEPAHALGFTTVLLGDVHPEPRPDYVDHWTRDLKAFLRQVLSE